MCIITKNNVENGGYEDLRRQRAAYLLFHDKIEPEPNDIDDGLWNWNISENSKPIHKFMLHQQLTQMKIYFANHIVNRIESSKNIFLLKLFLHLKKQLAYFFHAQDGTIDIEMDILSNDSFEVASEATVLDDPIATNEKKCAEQKEIKEMLENSKEHSTSPDGLFDDFETDSQNNSEEPNKKVIVEPSYIESVFLIDNNNNASSKSNLAMFRIKGLSGNDKTTLINGIKKDLNPDRKDTFVNFVTCSTYDYLIVSGEQGSEATQIQTAHKYFENHLRQDIKYKTRVVV